jgi:cyclin B
LNIYIIDRYLEKNPISREKLQLLGVAALFIASKYEEIYPPQLKDFVDVTDKTYTKADILEMEGKIILSLDFNLTIPSSLRFLERYSRILGLDK